VRRLAALSVVTLMLAACGGGSSSEQTSDAPEPEAPVTVPNRASDDSGDDAPDDGGAGTEPPVFFLVGERDAAPDGWVIDPANCSSSDESGPPLFDYLIPGEWEQVGSGYGGGGGSSGGGTHEYRLGASNDSGVVKVGIDNDTYDDDAAIRNAEGDTTESFDYTRTVFGNDGEDDDVTEVRFTELDPVTIDGQEVALFVLAQGDYEHLSGTEYRARLVFADLPRGQYSRPPRYLSSAVVSISWDEEETDFDEATVRDILASIRTADCTVDVVTTELEMIYGLDFSS